jgi:uncharacterized protein
VNRRAFLRGAAAAAAVPPALVGYARCEAVWLRVTRQAVAVPKLPPAFAGLTLALLTDIHHGPYNTLEYVHHVVERTNALGPDLIALGGDYVRVGSQFVRPCLAALGRLRAPLGVFAVPGNHDHWHNVKLCRQALRANGLVDLTNAGMWLERGGDRLRLAGVDDLWCGRPDLDAAVGSAGDADACVLLCHNPDFAEEAVDERVGLVLSGHTHGGQVYIPGIGAPRLPSRYGTKYIGGLVPAPRTRVFVSRGVGTVDWALRFCCRPEVNLLTLTAA